MAGWQATGVQVGHAGTLFLHRGMQRELAVPAGSARRCQTIVALAERHIRFELDRVGSQDEPTVHEPARGPSAASAPSAPVERSRAVASRAGVARLASCAAGGAPLARVRLTMRSTRGSVELLVARHEQPLPPLELVAPELAPGLVAAPGSLGRPVLTESLAERVARTSSTARLDGAVAVAQVQARASVAGTGALGLNLPAGCHRLTVMAGAPEGGLAAPDLDLEARRPGETQVLGQDRSNAPDGRIDLCVGEAGPVELRFLGANRAAPVALVAAHWPLPPAIARMPGEGRRAALAWGLFHRRAPAPRGPPLLQMRGGPGVTMLPVPLEPGACYLAVGSVDRGRAAAMRLTAVVGSVRVRDQSSEPPHGVAVSFCAGQSRRGMLQLELRAPLSWWSLLLWRVHGGRP